MPPNTAELYQQLTSISRDLAALEEQGKPLKQRARELIIELLKANEMPTDVADASPWSAEYCRIIARDARIPPAPQGLKPGGRKKPAGRSAATDAALPQKNQGA